MGFSRRIVHTVSWLWKMQIKLQIHHCEHSRPVRLKTKQRKDNHETQNVPASFLNGFKISDIDKLILALILRFGVIGLRNWTQSLAVSLPGIKTLIKRLFLLVFLYELSMSF